MFDWTADLTGTGDRSEYTVESYQINSYNQQRDTDIEALSVCIRSSALLIADCCVIVLTFYTLSNNLWLLRHSLNINQVQYCQMNQSKTCNYQNTKCRLELCTGFAAVNAHFIPSAACGLRGWKPVSEMTYTVSSGTLNSTIPYLTISYHTGVVRIDCLCFLAGCRKSRLIRPVSQHVFIVSLFIGAPFMYCYVQWWAHLKSLYQISNLQHKKKLKSSA